MTSPVQEMTKVLRKNNIQYDFTERHFPRSKKYPFGHSQDLFNIIDIIALDDGILGIQVCGGEGDYMKHVRKIIEEYKSNTINWIVNGGRLELWAWRRVKVKRGGKRMVWRPRIADILLAGSELYVEERNSSLLI